MPPPTVAADGAGADDDAELEEFAADALGAPERVLLSHAGDQLPGLGAKRLAIAGVGKDGRNRVEPIAGSSFSIPARALLVAIGEAPDLSILPKGSSLEVADWGGLLTDLETLMTAQPGVFAAGEVATGPKSVIEGVAQGQRAAWAIERYLSGDTKSRYIPPWRRRGAGLPSAERVQIDLSLRARAENELAARAEFEHTDRYQEVSQALSETVARAEASRCLRCDVIASCPVVKVKREVPA